MTDLTQLLRSAEPLTEPGFDDHDVARRVQQRARRRTVATATTTAVAVGIIAVLGAGPFDMWRRPPARVVLSQPPAATFVGTWVSTDTDGSSQTLEIVHSGGDDYEFVLRDGFATACSGGPATMTGAGRLETDERLVVAQPVLTCDDGTTPAIEPPLQAVPANFTLELDTATDELVDGFGVVWRRASSNDAAARPGGMWPQSTLDEVREAQERADAGDPAFTWQLDANLAAEGEPWGAEIFARFIEEGLGWEEFVSGRSFSFFGYAGRGGDYHGILFIRCAPGQTNPLNALYPGAPPEIRRCAPTIDELTYETVRLGAIQPARRGPSGIWVVNRWELLQSTSGPDSLGGLLYPDFDQRQVRQVVPPSGAEVTALLQAFLQARVDGEDAEPYLHREPEGSWAEDKEVPLLYATTSGAPYERFEIQRLQGPVWPNGWLEYKVRLFAEGGETVVGQRFHVVRHDGRLGLLYGEDESDPPTTENGEPVAVPQSVLLDTVTVTAPPLVGYYRDFYLETQIPRSDGRLIIAAEPQLDCDDERAPADAGALARGIMAVPNFETTEPVPARLAGRDWLQMDVTFSEEGQGPCLWINRPAGDPGWRVRLYLIDYPDESSPYLNVLMIAVIASETDFENVLEQATPIVESLEFHPG